jgi:hypothetical protein
VFSDERIEHVRFTLLRKTFVKFVVLNCCHNGCIPQLYVSVTATCFKQVIVGDTTLPTIVFELLFKSCTMILESVNKTVVIQSEIVAPCEAIDFSQDA